MTTRADLQPLTIPAVLQHLALAAGVAQDESFSDDPRNRPRYAEAEAAGIVTIHDEDRGDGLARIRISPTAEGRARRSLNPDT